MSNAALDALLSHRCSVITLNSTITAMITVETPSTRLSGVPCHIQTLDAMEVPKGFGYEETGAWELWVNSTALVAVGERILATGVGPYTGMTWNVRGYEQAAIEAGLEHDAFHMELDTDAG